MSLRIQVDPHTRERARERGASLEQIEDVIRTGLSELARADRFAKYKIYDYHGVWKGRFYDQQMVKVIYLVRNDVCITVTVVVHYGRWRDSK